jgi:S1-C subfamily serine protease
MSDGWYVRKGHKTLGPLTETEVRSVLKAGRIEPETPVRRGNDGPWIPAGQALSDATRDKAALAQSKANLRRPIAIAAGVGIVILVAGLFGVFAVRGRRAQPAPAAAPADDGVKTSDVASANPANETPVVPIATAPTPLKPRPSLVANRPVPSKAIGSPVPVDGNRASTNSVLPSTPGPQQKPAVAGQKPKAVAPIAPVVVPKAPATETDLRGLEARALRSLTAKDALALYHLFRATRAVAPTAQDLVAANLQVWEDRARQDLVRLGDQWVAAADAAKAHEEAVQLFQQAYEMTKNLNFDEARRTLERASRVDPNAIAADFTLGILNSIAPPKYRNPQAAAKHFQVVLQRIPGYVPALNNLALAEIREDKYAEAVGHLREAADRSPASEEVTQNLGRLVSEAQLGRIHPGESVLSEAINLVSQVSMRKDAAEQRHGWRYMPLVSPKEEREGLARFQAPEANSTTRVAQGTGFVVAPHYVLTCRNIVDDLTLGRADKIELIDPTDASHQRRLPATAVDVSQEDDLCLLRCDPLDVPSVSLADKNPPRGTEMVLIGFPGGSGFGVGLKASRGVVTALPGDVARTAVPKWLDFSRKVWCDAAPSPGASGGAVCDDRGNVVAIHSTSFRRSDDPSKVTYAAGVPAPNAAAFIRHSLPNFTHRPFGGVSLKWSDVEAKVGPSMVLVVVSYRKVAMVISEKAETSPLTRIIRQAQSDLYDDRVCTVCNGLVRVRCRAPGCPFAAHDENDPLHGGSSQKTDLAANPTTKSARRTCPACLGTGYVRCPSCSVGIDPLLR